MKNTLFCVLGFTSSPLFLFPVLDCPALTLQSSRSLDALSDLKLQRLEAELEGARHEAQGACQREEELKGECERLKEEMRMLQNSQRDRVSVGWVQSARRAARVGESTLNTVRVTAQLSPFLVMHSLNCSDCEKYERNVFIPEQNTDVYIHIIYFLCLT